MRMRGEILFHFKDVDAGEWAVIERTLPRD
jgi:hypothetical protein